MCTWSLGKHCSRSRTLVGISSSHMYFSCVRPTNLTWWRRVGSAEMCSKLRALRLGGRPARSREIPSSKSDAPKVTVVKHLSDERGPEIHILARVYHQLRNAGESIGDVCKALRAIVCNINVAIVFLTGLSPSSGDLCQEHEASDTASSACSAQDQVCQVPRQARQIKVACAAM